MNAGLLNVAAHVRVVGGLLLALAALNLLVPRRFGWAAELQRVSLFTRQVFAVHCGFIILMLVMMGVLSLCFAPALLERTTLGKVVLAGLAIFWVARLGVQFFVYSPKLWRGNRFNTAMHVLFSFVWAYFSAVYVAAMIMAMR